jgi:hypothetical protein
VRGGTSRGEGRALCVSRAALGLLPGHSPRTPAPYASLVPRSCEEVAFKVAPRKGDALLFFSLDPDLKVNHRSLHGSCPVKKGEWLRPLKGCAGGAGDANERGGGGAGEGGGACRACRGSMIDPPSSLPLPLPRAGEKWVATRWVSSAAAHGRAADGERLLHEQQTNRKLRRPPPPGLSSHPTPAPPLPTSDLPEPVHPAERHGARGGRCRRRGRGRGSRAAAGAAGGAAAAGERGGRVMTG